jgi:hypothetical protein
MLPEISDPDKDAWTVDVKLGEAITFAYFKGNKLTFAP